MAEGDIFALCVSPHLDGGYLGVPQLRSGWRGGLYPSQVWMGVPHPRSGWWGVLQGTPPRTGWVPPPQPGLDGVPPPLRTGYGNPPPELDGVTPNSIRQSSTASTCYSAGGMPLAFTQEDFLVQPNVFLPSDGIHNDSSGRYQSVYGQSSAVSVIIADIDRAST